MALLKFIFLFLFISIYSYGSAEPSTKIPSLPWVIKLKTQYTDESNKQNIDIQGAGTLFKYKDEQKERWFILTVAHVTQGRFFEAFVMDETGKSIYQFKKIPSTTTKPGFNEAIDHLSDVHIFEVQAPPKNIVNKEAVPVAQFKGVVQGKNLYRLYLPQQHYQSEEEYSIAKQLTVPHPSWVQEKGFLPITNDTEHDSPYGLQFSWTEKEYAVDSHVVHGMSGLPALTFDRRVSMYAVLGVIKSFHRQRMETYLVSDKAISSVFEAVAFGQMANPNQENLSITWRYRSPFGTYRYFQNQLARFSEIGLKGSGLSFEKAGGSETSDGGGGKKSLTPDKNISGPEKIEWQWSGESKPQNVGAFSVPTPDEYRPFTYGKRVWISPAIRSLEFIGFTNIFSSSSSIQPHPLNIETLQASFNDRIKGSSEVIEVTDNNCQITMDYSRQYLKIEFKLSYRREFSFAKNDSNYYLLKVPLKQIIEKGFIFDIDGMQVNIQGLFFFDPINSYGTTPIEVKQNTFIQLLAAYVVLKNQGNKNNQLLNVACTKAANGEF
ncbi:MAG: hypothetical protein ACXVCP_07450 [Bdellovibrio sp.]